MTALARGLLWWLYNEGPFIRRLATLEEWPTLAARRFMWRRRYEDPEDRAVPNLANSAMSP